MQTDIFTLCDSFNQDGPKFDIRGLAGCTYIIDPATQSECSIVAIIRSEIHDEADCPFRFSLTHIDGDVVISREFAVPAIRGDSEQAHIQVSSFPVNQFRYSGRYLLELYADGSLSRSVPVIVHLPGVAWDQKVGG